ncbi:response regulator [Archaeoglobus neptunius]|uniref:response regulator n=1 Tax=Archaeoglobus neptunius TaxID=2798580 RepID=UPI001928D1C4|nr:response regulator [Archaeoglobus neptunius]
MRALVVDDNEDVYEIFKIILQEFEVYHARNGKEAVEMYRKLKPDIVLMDIFMPVMDGIYASKEILSMDPRAKIIAVTAFAKREDVLKSVGVKEVIEKPFTKRELIQIIDTVVRG